MSKEAFIKTEPALNLAFIKENLLIMPGKYLSIWNYEKEELVFKKDCKKDLKIPHALEIDVSDYGFVIALNNILR